MCQYSLDSFHLHLSTRYILVSYTAIIMLLFHQCLAIFAGKSGIDPDHTPPGFPAGTPMIVVGQMIFVLCLKIFFVFV